MTVCVCKANGVGVLNDFPPLNKPDNWCSRKIPSASYGELKYLNIVRNIAASVLDDDIDQEVADPESGIIIPKPRGLRALN